MESQFQERARPVFRIRGVRRLVASRVGRVLERLACVGVNLCIDRFAQQLRGCLKSMHIVGCDAAIQPPKFSINLAIMSKIIHLPRASAS